MELERFDWDESLKGMLEMIDDESKKNNSSSSNQISPFPPSNFITTPTDEPLYYSTTTKDIVIPDNPAVSNICSIHNPVGRTRDVPFVHSRNRVEGYYLKGLFRTNERIGETSLSQEQCKLSSSTVKPSIFDGEIDNICQQPVEVVSSSQNPYLSPRNVALVEIKAIVSAICRVHQLPLALTWIPCNHALRIEESACYWTTHMEGFVRACKDQFLGLGQGIAGKALQLDQPMFHGNVKIIGINEYPLVEHAHKFGLGAAIAIKHRSGSDDYILEFFLPVNIKVAAEQELLINNIATTLEMFYRGLKKVPNVQLLKENNIKFDVLDCDQQDVERIRQDAQPTESTSRQTVVDVDVATDQMKDDAPSGQAQVAKKRAVNEKLICLSDLEPYYCGSLKYCAQSLGVSPTTVKRVCRQNGIPRWPCRKIQKVKRSLKRIQNVLEGVQGGGLMYDSRSRKLSAIGSLIQLDLSNTLCLAKPTQNTHLQGHGDAFGVCNSSVSLKGDDSGKNNAPQGSGEWKTVPSDSAPVLVSSQGRFGFNTFGAWKTVSLQDDGIVKSCEGDVFGTGNNISLQGNGNGNGNAPIVESSKGMGSTTFGKWKPVPRVKTNLLL